MTDTPVPNPRLSSSPLIPRKQPFLAGYRLATALAVGALVVRALLDIFVGTNIPYLFSLGAVTLTAFFVGFRPGLLCTLISTVGVNVLLQEPRFHFSMAVPSSELLGLMLFVLVGSGISWLGGHRLEAYREATEVGAQLWEREAQLRALTDNMPGAMTFQAERIPGKPTHFLYVSTSVERLAGVRAADVYADPLALYQLVLPSHLPAMVEAEKEAVAQGTPFFIEVPIRRLDGQVRWMQLASSLRTVTDGRQIWDGVMFDITERHAAQEELERLNAGLEQRIQERTEQLTRSNLELQQFAYVASHDLKAPLRTVISFMQLLSRKYEDQLDAKAGTYISYSVQAAERMNTLIDDLLAFSRIGRDRQVTQVDAEAALQDALSNLQAVIEERGARIHHEPLPRVMTDATQLRQVLQNLIGNALKFQAKDRTPEVHIRGSRNGGMVIFSVQDNGIGIDPEHFERIFGTFQRLHTQDQFAGSGVGLAIVQKIIQESGGQVWVTSVPDHGATFYFSLPAAMDETPSSSATPESNSQSISMHKN